MDFHKAPSSFCRFSIVFHRLSMLLWTPLFIFFIAACACVICVITYHRMSALSARAGVEDDTRTHLPMHTPECKGARKCSYAPAGRSQGCRRGLGRDHGSRRPRALQSAGVLEHALGVPPSQRDTRLRAKGPARTSGSRAKVGVSTL